MHLRSAIALAGGVWLLLSSTVARAGYLSEVFISGLPGSTTPNGVEIANLTSLSPSTVDLVVIDATPARQGRVLQVVTLATADSLLLVSDTPWPTGLWGELTPPATRITLADLPAASDTTWDFGKSRTLILYDRPTSLVAHGGTLDEQAAGLNGAVALDWITFERDWDAAAWDGETIFDTTQGSVITRPLDETWNPRDGFIGDPTASGTLDMAAPDPDVPLTPGYVNPIWMPNPEPASAGLLIVAAALFYVRRPPMMQV